jgi:NAD(P)-dependent dehydrogenase (short-subunit alcohol dehydrogenase family)
VNAQQVDLRTTNSWLLTLEQVSTAEAVEVMAVNSLAPMIINARLKALMERSRATDKAGSSSARGDIGRYIVNVSAMEGT